MPMRSERCYKMVMTMHVGLFIPFIICFATNSWATYSTPWYTRQFGLWKMCTRARNTTLANGTLVVLWKSLLEDCQDHNIHELPVYFHLSRALLCLTLVAFVLGFATRWSITCQPEDKTTVLHNLAVQAPVLVLFFGGLSMFWLYKEDFDEENGVVTSLGGSSIAASVVCCLQVVAIVFTSFTLFELTLCKSCCQRENSTAPSTTTTTTAATTTTSRAPTATAATTSSQRMSTSTTTTTSTLASAGAASSSSPTTTVTVTSRVRKPNTKSVATSTTPADMSEVEIPRPPPYDVHALYNAFLELYNAGYHADRANPSANPTAGGVGANTNTREDPSNIFTVVVNQADSHSETDNRASLAPPPPGLLYRPQPALPPPRYERVGSTEAPQMLTVPPEIAPPPSYEIAMMELAPGGSPDEDNTRSGGRQVPPPPPSYSDV